jgi:hypothetical protein
MRAGGIEQMAVVSGHAGQGVFPIMLMTTAVSTFLYLSALVSHACVWARGRRDGVGRSGGEERGRVGMPDRVADRVAGGGSPRESRGGGGRRVFRVGGGGGGQRDYLSVHERTADGSVDPSIWTRRGGSRGGGGACLLLRACFHDPNLAITDLCCPFSTFTHDTRNNTLSLISGFVHIRGMQPGG